MRIKLVLFGYLKNLVKEDFRGKDEIEFSSPLTVKEALDSLGISGYHVSSIQINGQPAKDNQVLNDGDELRVVPLVGGG